MWKKILYNSQIGLDAISQNRVRGLLTSLGIIFGVASVITMLAIGRGAQAVILEQMQILGTNNIIIKPIFEQKDEKLSEDNSGKKEHKKYSPGLSLMDAESILQTIPHVEMVSAEIILESNAMKNGTRRSVKLIGADRNYFEIGNIKLGQGSLFTESQMMQSLPVCIIGSAVKSRFFPSSDPIGKRIKCGQHWLTIIGVVRDRNISKSSIKTLGLRDFNMDIYIPVSSLLLRYRNRSKITMADLVPSWDEEENTGDKDNYHQLDQLIVRIDNSDLIPTVAEIINRLLVRRHNQVVDCEVIIPELLLEQEKRTKEIFNNVLLAIACISLLVGGIGIMNIMLASVMERIKEIGVRLSMGATKQDIILQFLSEAVFLSISGGIIGIVTGMFLSYLIQEASGIPTDITLLSVLVSFFVAFIVGVIFGLFPAKKAAEQDPVNSLRHE